MQIKAKTNDLKIKNGSSFPYTSLKLPLCKLFKFYPVTSGGGNYYFPFGNNKTKKYQKYPKMLFISSTNKEHHINFYYWKYL